VGPEAIKETKQLSDRQLKGERAAYRERGIIIRGERVVKLMRRVDEIRAITLIIAADLSYTP